jgi:plastocyanin
VTGLPASLAPGESAQLTARASLSDGTSQDVTAQAAWRSENTAVATVSSGGLVTAVAAGTTEIRATYQTATAGAMLEVRQSAPPPPGRYSVCGDVTELGVGPLAGAHLEVRDGVNARRITETDAAGAYCLRDLMPDSFLLRAFKAGYDDVDERVTLSADTTVRFTIKKSPVTLYSLCGTIRETASAAVLSGVLVEIRSGPNTGKSTTSDGAGKYCLASLQTGSFTVRASKAQYDAADRPVTLTGDATLDINLLVSTPTVTIRAGGVMSPSPITIAVGQRVTFVNANSTGHQISSDPHPSHTDCPELQLTFLSPGQSGSSAVFTRAVTCGYHDHLNPSLVGRVIVR